MQDHRPEAPSDDRAALEELERLQRSIESYRRQRARAEQEFERFVGSFHPAPESAPSAAGSGAVAREADTAASEVRASSPAAATARPASPFPVPAGPPPAVERLTPAPTLPERLPAELPAPAVGRDGLFGEDPAERQPDQPGSEPDHAVPQPDQPERQGEAATAPGLFEPQASARRSRVPLFAAALAVLLVGAFLMMRLRPGAAPEPTAQPAPVTATRPAPTPTAALPQATAPAPTPAPPAPSAPPSTSTPAAAGATAPAATSPPAATGPAGTPFAEIRTIRRAWVRVLVDGRKEVEREVEAGAAVPLPAGTTFVVRAGDAGAVHFVLKGKDLGPLGRDAQVVTRTFP